MPDPNRDPLAATDRLLIDGPSLLAALRSTPGAALPATALIGRLRAAIPAPIGIELVLDGSPDRGMRGERIASGVLVRHAGTRSVEALLIDLADATRAAAGASGANGLLVVSDASALRTAVGRRGTRTAGTRWLVGRLDRHGTRRERRSSGRMPP